MGSGSQRLSRGGSEAGSTVACVLGSRSPLRRPRRRPGSEVSEEALPLHGPPPPAGPGPRHVPSPGHQRLRTSLSKPPEHSENTFKLSIFSRECSFSPDGCVIGPGDGCQLGALHQRFLEPFHRPPCPALASSCENSGSTPAASGEVKAAAGSRSAASEREKSRHSCNAVHPPACPEVEWTGKHALASGCLQLKTWGSSTFLLFHPGPLQAQIHGTAFAPCHHQAGAAAVPFGAGASHARPGDATIRKM
ncbi:uncharacterized protein AAG666_023883 [Megaptera novaeangliae]